MGKWGEKQKGKRKGATCQAVLETVGVAPKVTE